MSGHLVKPVTTASKDAKPVVVDRGGLTRVIASSLLANNEAEIKGIWLTTGFYFLVPYLSYSFLSSFSLFFLLLFLILFLSFFLFYVYVSKEGVYIA